MSKKNQLSLISAARAGEKKTEQIDKILSVQDYGNLYKIESIIEEKDSPQLPTRAIAEKYGQQVFNHLPQGYTFAARLGKGAYGTTFRICRSNFECLAFKIIEVRDGKEEVNA